jgi:circadian clock protein KaiB
MTHAGASATPALKLRLYVAGGAPNSLRALANLNAVCAALKRPVEVEVVDVLDTPIRALDDGIVLTPTLVRLAPLPAVRMVGDLSDTVKVRAALGMGGDDHAG